MFQLFLPSLLYGDVEKSSLSVQLTLLVIKDLFGCRELVVETLDHLLHLLQVDQELGLLLANCFQIPEVGQDQVPAESNASEWCC